MLFTTDSPEVIDGITPVAPNYNYSISMQDRSVLVTGIQKSTRYTLVNSLGQIINLGTWNGVPGATLRLKVPSAGRYMLQIGNKSQVIMVK
jgi:hypothetical protein